MHFKTQIYRLWMIVRQFAQSVCNFVRTRFRKKPNIFLIGTPEYGNLGDQLIALGELQWLRDHFPNIPIREFTHETLMRDRRCRVLLSQIRKEDILFLQGGGNINDKYPNCERIRRIVIQKKPKNQIVLFPQTISFASTPDAQAMKKETADLYNTNPHLTILTREDTSFSLANEMFPSLRTMLVPDIATYLFPSLSPSAAFPRSGIALCLRTDGEKYYTDRDMKDYEQKLSAYGDVCLTGTNLFRTIPPYQRILRAQEMIDFMSKKKLIVTDRFHGVIFSILSRTPCIALRSSDHKIVDGVKWFNDLPGVFFAKDIEDALRLADSAYALGEQPQADFSRYFEQLYQDLHLDFGKE